MTKTEAPEFSKIVRLDAIGAAPVAHRITAEVAERQALARRFGLQEISALTGDFTLSHEAAGYRARGRVQASVVQSCAISAEPVPEDVDEPVDVLFVRSLPEAEPEAEFEISETECDTVLLTGQGIDLGELAAETMALALDPYPRATDAVIAEARRYLIAEDEARAAEAAAKATKNPFAALKKG